MLAFTFGDDNDRIQQHWGKPHAPCNCLAMQSVALCMCQLGRIEIAPALEGVLPMQARSPPGHGPSVDGPLQKCVPFLQVVVQTFSVVPACIHAQEDAQETIFQFCVLHT